MVYLVGVLPPLSVSLVGLVHQHFHPFAPASFVLAGLSNGVQLPHLVLEEGRHRAVRGLQTGRLDTERASKQAGDLALTSEVCSPEALEC